MPAKHKWKLVTDFTMVSYRCGLRAGQRVALKRDLVIQDHRGHPTGECHPAGEVWTVLIGSHSDPGVVWFRQPDGERHSWDDDAAEIAAWFEVLPDGPAAPAGG